MGMPQAAHDWTVERVLALPNDGNRYEVVDGELLVSPAPSLRHQDVVLALILRLQPFVTSSALGHLSIAPADIELDDRTLVQPDVFVFRMPGNARPESWKDVRDILLAVEVISPRTARADRQVKRRRYQRYGVPEYWIVDAPARLVERWRPDDLRPEVLTDSLEWRPTGEADGALLVIDLHEFFREVLDG
jgi:Uma2 family endonuclease